jgi:hypothetical protein
VEAKEIRESTEAETEEIRAKAIAEEEEILVQATVEVKEILAVAHCGRPLTMGHPIPVHAGDEARHAAAHFLSQEEADAEEILT